MTNKIVRDFNHTLLWPVQLRSLRRTGMAAGVEGAHRGPGAVVAQYWDILKKNPGSWKYVEDALLIEDESCQVGLWVLWPRLNEVLHASVSLGSSLL